MSQEQVQELERLCQRVAELEVIEEKYTALEKRMEASEERFRGILDNLLEGCQVIGFDWRYTYVNNAVVKHSRFSREELLGRTMMEVYPGIENTDMFAALKDCMETRIPRRMENEFTFPDGSTGWFDLSIEPVPEGIFILSVERTEQKRFEEYSNQQYRLASIGQFAAGIAHDFNNILTVMTGTAQLMEMNPRIPEDAYEDLNAIYTQGQRAAQLIRQILDFSRETVVKRQPVDLIPFLKESVKLLGRMLPEDIEIQEDFPRKAWARANLSQLQQVLNNLAANSRDAMPEGGCVEIQVSMLRLDADGQPPCPDMPAGNWICWTFSDTGAGIPRDVAKHIFEPFYTTKPRGKGTGLGLAQVYGIVRQHDGFIDVRSEEGEGTTFAIYLPEYTESRRPQEKDDIRPVSRGEGQTLLVVEDEEPVLKVIRIMLETLGYRVVPAINGHEALEAYAAHRDEIALVLTDLVMPQMGGKELIEHLLEQDPDLSFVMMSGYASDIATYEGLVEKAAGILEKPLVLKEVADTVRKALTKE